ncbi:MAG TPA: tetratricopeptide repeat protein [Thermoanaerobaculia bacterium]|nr:tetratricopeptide repeat protein [Thermoanaerobaculia bacterium]
MAMSPLAAPTEKFLYEFDAFQVDPVRRRLLRDRELVSLTPKAFSILMVLLENRGEVVEKEELIRKVWADAFVTEANLTQNVSSLRKALGERANDHKYVVTVPGRGYSFVAEVTEVLRRDQQSGEFPMVSLSHPAAGPVATPALLDESGVFRMAPPAAAGAVAAQPMLDESGVFRLPPLAAAPAALPSAPLVPPIRGRRRFLLAGLVLGFLVAILLAGLFVSYQNRKRDAAARPLAGEAAGTSRPAGFRPTVAVLGFRNLSGDRRQTWLTTALAEMLTTELSAGSKVRMISGEEIARVKQTLSLPYTEDLSAASLQQIHDGLGADLVVVGAFLSLGDNPSSRIRIDLRVLKTPEGDTVASLAEVGTEENLFELVSLIGGKLRQNLGWAPPSPEEAKAVQALQPGNSEANRLYNEGLIRLRAFDSAGARDRLLEAAQADPRSAVIRSTLSLAWSRLGHDAEALQEAERALQLAAALPQEERLATEARFNEAKKDWNRAAEIYRSLWTFYPDNLEYGLGLANSLTTAGRIPEALATVTSMRKLPPPSRDDPGIDVVAALVARQQGDPAKELQLGKVAAEKGQRQGQTQIVGEALLLQGGALYIMGRPDEAIDCFRRADELFASAGNQAARARTLNKIGAVLLDVSDFSGAEKRYDEALAIARQLGSNELIARQKMAMAFVATDLGDLERSRALTEEVHASFVEQGDQLYETRSLFKLAEVLWEMGDTAGARQGYDEALVMARKASNQVEETRALNGIGRSLVSTGELADARGQQEQALRIAHSSGDPTMTASYRAAVGQTLILQGDLAAARQHLEQALAGKRQVRDRLGASRVLGLLSRLAQEQGDLGLARRYAAEQRALAEQIHAVLATASALQRQGRLAIAAGDFKTARERLSEALRLSDPRKAAQLATAVRLDLAHLALLERLPAEAERLSREVAGWYGQRKMPADQSRALAVQSQALLALGRAADARRIGEQAHSISGSSTDLNLQILVVTAIAPAGVAVGERASSMGHLRWAVGEAGRVGYVEAGLEARFILGALQLQTGDALTGRTTLQAVRQDAEVRGFKGIAQRAAAILQGSRPVLG